MGNGFGEKQYINFPLPLLRNLMYYKTRTLRGVIVYEALRTGKDWHVVLYEIGTTQYKELHELGCSQNELYRKYRNSMSMVLDKINSGMFERQPSVGIKSSTLRDYLYNEKTEEDWTMLLLWLSVKSISKELICKTSGEYIVARMAGYKTFEEMKRDYPNTSQYLVALIEDGGTGRTARDRRRKLYDRLEATYKRVYFFGGFKCVWVVRSNNVISRDEAQKRLEEYRASLRPGPPS